MTQIKDKIDREKRKSTTRHGFDDENDFNIFWTMNFVSYSSFYTVSIPGFSHSNELHFHLAQRM